MDDEELITPLQASALIGHFQANKVKLPEKNYRKKLFLQTIRTSKDIRQFKDLAVQKGYLTRAQAEAYHHKADVFNIILAHCRADFLRGVWTTRQPIAESSCLPCPARATIPPTMWNSKVTPTYSSPVTKTERTSSTHIC